MNGSSGIFTGILLLKAKIASHTYHIRIQSMDFLQQGPAASLTAEIFLSNPYYAPKTTVHQCSFWNYEPVYHTVDLAVHTGLKDAADEWADTVQEGDMVFFRAVSEGPAVDETGDNYFLIGGSTALSRLYEINRTLAVSKNISSLVYAEQEEELFPDLDHSFPLDFFISKPLQPQNIITHIRNHFPECTNTIAYILGDEFITKTISETIRKNPSFGIRKFY
ncbi:MAG: hypothetical protein LBE92_02850 [Chryseobacterium sp.]|jgi:hypothetical protein|uniref:hypothetical protein n=1 Tax=Chryseobacterium sp. TaxID=1871047 RepID=UPI002834303C|nr:hypothetical protein [Chryseobacterium sp.]MDR2235037.1 hypothetical protein [Chryseobacterium sp.]